jgi:hypothetical protein
MIARWAAVPLGALAALVLLGGCEPKRTSEPWANPLDGFEARLARDAKDNNYILQRMEFGRTALVLGCDLRAKPRLMEAFEQLGVERDNTAAALTTEQLKYYKGETYERAMLATYLGILEYRAGQYNNARILFSRALAADRAAVVKDTTPQAYGEDFGLTFYWLGRTFAKMSDADQCAIAFRKAAARTGRKEAEKELAADQKRTREWEKQRLEGEQWVLKTFHDPKKQELYVDGIVNLAEVTGTIGNAPARLAEAAGQNPIVRSTDSRDEFFTSAYQADANTVLTIEVGRAPFKYLTGMHGERTEFGRSVVAPRAIRVYVDGHYAGQAFEVLDLWDQAATQDRIAEKDAAQAGKAVLKEILSYAPYAGSAVGYWNVQGDIRHWTTLPGKVFVFAGKLAPGPHTVRLQMYDCCGNLLPRWTNTYYGIGIPKEGEACLDLVGQCEGDNRLPPDLVQKAINAGARPGAWYGY